MCETLTIPEYNPSDYKTVRLPTVDPSFTRHQPIISTQASITTLDVPCGHFTFTILTHVSIWSLIIRDGFTLTIVHVSVPAATAF